MSSPAILSPARQNIVKEARTRGFASLAFASFAFYIRLAWGAGETFNAEKYLTSALGQKPSSRLFLSYDKLPPKGSLRPSNDLEHKARKQ